MERKRKESIQVWSERRVKEKEKKKNGGVEIREKKKERKKKKQKRKEVWDLVWRVKEKKK